jgi:hypothetical protein
MLGMSEVAAMVGVGYESIRVYRGRAEQNRRNGIFKPGDLPPADSYRGQSPEWKLETIEAWIAGRPRKGKK